jgi:hypothetical protein
MTGKELPGLGIAGDRSVAHVYHGVLNIGVPQPVLHKGDIRASVQEMHRNRVVYGYVTDNSGVGECSKIGFFPPHGRGPHHGAESVVLPTHCGGSRPHLSPYPYRVA